MCFYSDTNKTKIASKPIRVYKVLVNTNKSPIISYRYYRGLNIPEYPISRCYYDKIHNFYEYRGGWLHTLKHYKKQSSSIFLIVMMFIPKGCEYHDAGIALNDFQDCTNHIISKALYWPKNWFDYIKWHIKSIF